MTGTLRENNRLRRWEAALLAGVAVAMLWGVWLDREQAALADKVIRLHVLANSDSEADQTLKLRVRDRILAEAADLFAPGETVAQARETLTLALPALAEAGAGVVREEGYEYAVSASLEENVWFPTKQYTEVLFGKACIAGPLWTRALKWNRQAGSTSSIPMLPSS